MTQIERAEFIQNFFNKNCVSLLQTKGKEYSQFQPDVNSNFKRLADEIELTPKKVLWVYLKKHIDAIISYIKRGQVESEPIESRIADAINYLFILASLIHEEQQKESLDKRIDYQKIAQNIQGPCPEPGCIKSLNHSGEHNNGYKNW